LTNDDDRRRRPTHVWVVTSILPEVAVFTELAAAKRWADRDADYSIEWTESYGTWHAGPPFHYEISHEPLDPGVSDE